MTESNSQPGLVELVIQGVRQRRACDGRIIFGKRVREMEANMSALGGGTSSYRQKSMALSVDGRFLTLRFFSLSRIRPRTQYNKKSEFHA